MAKVTAQFKSRYGESGPNIIPLARNLDRALEILYREGIISACETKLRYLCHALMRPYAIDQQQLIADANRFPQIINYLESRRDTLPIYGWQGLLNTYFQFDGGMDDNSKANWRQLRTFLNKTLANIQARITGHRTQQWMSSLIEHRNLLTDDPCGRYAPAVLCGNFHEINTLRNNLHIPEHSWFWIALLRSQAQTLTALNDDNFEKRLAGVLRQILKPSIVPDILARLLDRYYHSRFKNTAHAELQKMVIETWGSPNFGRNIRWGHIDNPEVRQMVQRWLSREDIQDFFYLLLQDKVGDERRLRFWMRYADQIQETHIALGKHALSNDPDYVEIRKRKSGRVSILIDNDSKNNAFIMNFGQYVVVEFGVTGNACYIYAGSKFPMPEYSKVQNNAMPTNRIFLGEIKNRSLGKWLSHGSTNWEERFESVLEQLKIYPSIKQK